MANPLRIRADPHEAVENIDLIYLWDRVLDLAARRQIQNNPYQFVKPRLSGRTYVAYGIAAPAPPGGDSGKGSIVIAIAS